MKKRFTILIAALAAILIMAQPGKVMGQTSYEITCNMSNQGWSNSTAIGEGTLKKTVNNAATNTDFTYTSGTGDSGTTEGPKYFTSGTNVRFYVSRAANTSTPANGNWMQINIPSNTTVTGIEITGVSNYTPTIKYNVDGAEDVELSASNNKYTVSSISATSSFKFRNTNTSTTGNTQLRITAIKITYTTSSGSTPTISTNPASLSSFTYVEGNGPSAAQTISVSGSNLTADISLSLGNSSNFEMSTAEGSGYTNSLTLTQSNGSVAATTIYVRLKEGLNVANNYSGTINLTSTGATAGSVSLSGSVTQPEAPNVTWDLSTNSYVSDPAPTTELIQWTSTQVAMKNERNGSTNTAVNNYIPTSNSSTRFYSGNRLTITPVVGYKISSVVFTATTNGYASALKNSSWTNASASMESGNDVKVVTVTPTENHEHEAISAAIGGTCGFTEVKVYYITATTRTITFYGNGGTYNEAPTYTQTVNDGVATALTANQFTNSTPNTAFAGWSTTADGTVVYADGASVTLTTNLTLYAKWSQSYTATVSNSIENGTVKISTAGGEVTTTIVAEGAEVTLTNTPDEGYEFSAWDVYKTGETATKVTVTNNKFTMPAYNVTISATFVEATTYSLITDIGDLVSGKRYIIASGANGDIQAMGSQNSSHYRNVVSVSSDNGVIVEPVNVYEFVINGPEIITKNNQTVLVYTIYDVTGVSGGYLYANSSSNNQMETQAFNDNNGKWTISIANTGAATIDAQGTNSKYRMRFNSDRFACYGSTTTQALPYIYVKNEVTPQYEFYKDITAHTDATGEGNTDGWYFIASPVNSNMAPNSVTNMIAGDADKYDLYRLSGNTLENYKNNEHTAGFIITNGAGYLYSNASNTTLKFSGTLIKEYNNTNKTVTPAHTGWNLIGNPFTFPVRVSRAFSELNNGSAVNSKDANSIINPGAGIIVYGTEGVTFTKYEPGEQSSGSNNINIMLAQQVVSRDGFSTTSVAIDNAVISFNENSSLPKFTLLEGNAKLYIPQYGDEYAIAFSDRQGEVPVCFKAKEVGTYTISFETQDFETNDRASLQGAYLIDVLEEEEIDLSVNPSYTFIGSPADRAERFKIVFRNNVNDIFAYQNGSDIVVTGEGELQIFDVMGRIVSKQYVSGVETINVNAHGVYIMKLNGMTQKIIIK